MDYINDINVNEAVINILNNNGGEAVVNEHALDLTENVYRFIYKHVEKCFKDENLRYAKFKEERSIVKELCLNYLNGNDHDLIKIAGELGKQLFAIMRGNTNIPSCDLIVTSLVTDKGPFIGILKLDYEKSFTHSVEIIDNKIGIDLVAHSEVLPGSTKKIKKAAFMRPYKENQEFDLLVLDLQNKSKKNEEYGATYFIENFLGCEIVEEDRYKTQKFIGNTEQWIKESIDDPYRILKIKEKLRDELKEVETINLEKFADKVLNDDENRSYKMFMSGLVEDNEFNCDENYINKKLRKVKLKIDGNIELTMSKETYDEKVELAKNGDGTINLIIKFIESIS